MHAELSPEVFTYTGAFGILGGQHFPLENAPLKGSSWQIANTGAVICWVWG